MKATFLTTVAALALISAATTASAADLAARPYTKAPPMMAAAYDWTGFYIGVNGGGGYAHDHRFNNVGTSLGSYDAKGGTAGGQIGYRWQSAGWVWGIEAQGNWADFEGSTVNAANLANQVTSNVDAFGLFTGQLGYAWNNVLLYAKGGAAIVDRRFDFVNLANTAVLSSSGYSTRWGASVGGGLEFGVSQNWTLGMEYNHIFLSRNDTQIGTGVFNPYSTGGDVDVATVRLNYKWGGPVIGRF